MSWNERHSRSERLAAEAETAIRAGDTAKAQRLYELAAIEEAAALEDLKDDRQRTRGITAVSTVALWYKARSYPVAETFAHRYLALGSLPHFASAQLRDLLQAIWASSAAEKAGIRFVPGDVLVSVKGGQVIYGGAPLDLIVRKVEGIQAMLFRTVEMLLERPFRKRGGPSTDIQSMFRPWLFQAPAGSYQFAVRMQEPAQANLWKADRIKLNTVTSTFFNVLRATSANPEIRLPEVVPSTEYRKAFLNLSRDLSPTGTSFERLEVRDAGAPSEPLVTLTLPARQELNSALRKLRPPEAGEQVQIIGVLRAVHLDKDWLEITATNLAGAEEHIRVWEATDALDDVVGPMVNRRVVVTALRRGSKYAYRDIEADE